MGGCKKNRKKGEREPERFRETDREREKGKRVGGVEIEGQNNEDGMTRYVSDMELINHLFEAIFQTLANSAFPTVHKIR